MLSVDADDLLKQVYSLANNRKIVGLCANGIKKYGIYYDSYATILDRRDTNDETTSLQNELPKFQQLIDDIYSSNIDSYKDMNSSDPSFDVVDQRYFRLTHDITPTGRTNKFIVPNKFLSVKSCFGGVTLYNFTLVHKAIKQHSCRYVAWISKRYLNKTQYPLYQKMNLFKYDNVLLSINMLGFATGFTTHAVCEHIPFHLCLLEATNNTAQLVIARDAKAYMGMER